MDVNLIKYFFLFLCLLIFSAFFSGSEVAFFSLNKDKINQNFLKHRGIYKIITYLMKSPSQLLITILIGNTIVNVSIAIVAVFITIEIIKQTSSNEIVSIFVEIILVTIILLIFGEVSPKILARKYSISFSKIAALPLFIIYILLSPITKLLQLITSSINLNLLFKTKKEESQNVELRYLINLMQNQSNLDLYTKKFLKYINELSNLVAKDVQIPRVKLSVVEINAKVDDLIALFRKTKTSYIPVYEQKLDNIVGVVSIQSVLKLLNEQKNQNITLYDLIEKPIYFPETKKVGDIILEFQNSKVPVGIVIDEHGGFSGMITEENIFSRFIKV